MSLTATTTSDVIQLATFRVGGLLMGIENLLVQEINRQLDTTPCPQAPHVVRGVINLRGEVVTVIDLRAALGMSSADLTSKSCNLIVHWQEERIGLWIDEMAEIVTVATHQIGQTPEHVSDLETQLFRGVFQLNDEIIVLLDMDEVLTVASVTEPSRTSDNS